MEKIHFEIIVEDKFGINQPKKHVVRLLLSASEDQYEILTYKIHHNAEKRLTLRFWDQ